MLNQTETAMMESTNFKFMSRSGQTDLADDAATIERLVHLHERAAIRELGSFGERLLKVFVFTNHGPRKQPTQNGGWKDPDFGWLLGQCTDRNKDWFVPQKQRDQFDVFREHSNPLKHRIDSSIRLQSKELLRSAFELSCWIGKKLKWHEVPSESDYIEPPKLGADDGAVKEALIRASKSEQRANEATKRAEDAERRAAKALSPVNLTHWIRQKQRAIAPPPNFTGREFAFRRIEQFLNNPEPRVLLIEGQPGRGKTGIIKKFLAADKFAGFTPLAYCFDYQNSVANPKEWMQHLYASLLDHLQIEENDHSIVNADVEPEDLRQRLLKRLWDFATSHPDQKTLLVIDAVDEAGKAEPTVKSLLLDDLPKTVKLIATTRPGHVRLSSNGCGSDPASIQPFNLEDVELLRLHRQDARQYVDAVLKQVADDVATEVARLSDGNFLILRLVCQELRSISESRIAGRVRELMRLKNAGKDLQAALFERAWLRLQENLDRDPELLNLVYRLAGLLAIARIPLPESMIRSVLDLSKSKAHWDILRRHFIEYLTEIDPPTNESQAVDEDAAPAYRLFHETFKVFVQQQLKTEMKDFKNQFATYCVKQIRNAGDACGRDYALRFAVQHLIEAEHADHWNELIQLLTDLDFIEARFTNGQGYDLLEDYELALRNHPDTHDQLSRRDERDDKLQNWVKAMVEYSRQCADIRGKYARNEIPDAVAIIQELTFPEPIDTSATIKDMKAAEARSQRRRHTSDAAVSLFEFRAFIRSQFDDLNEVPHSTFGIASNCSTKSAVAEAARQIEAKHTQVPILRREPRIDLSNQSSLVTRIGYGAVPDEQFIEWMTADARIGVGYGCDGCLDFIWDLRSGRRLPTDDGEFRILGVTLDGRYVATSEIILIDKLCVANRIALLDVRSGEVWRELEFALNEPNVEYSNGDVKYPFGITPDGSLFVFRSGDELVVWDTESKELSQRIVLDGIDPQALVLCSSGCVVAVFHEEEGNPRWTFFDLLSQTRLDESEEWFAADFRVARRLRNGKRTANDALRLDVEGADSWPQKLNQRIVRKDGTPVRSFDASFPFGQLKCLSADGRYALASKWRDCCYLIDLAIGVWTERDPVGNSLDASCQPATESVNSPESNHAVTARRLSDEELLAEELQFAIQETADDWKGYWQQQEIPSFDDMFPAEINKIADRDLPEFSPETLVTMPFPLPDKSFAFMMGREGSPKPTDYFRISHGPGDALMSPDGRFLLSDHCSTSQREANDDRRQMESSAGTVQLKKQYIAATVTDLSNSDSLAIEGPRRMLAVTRDGAAVVFTGDSDRPADRDGDRLTFWGIKLQDWLPENECSLNSQFSGTVESPYPPLHPGVLQSPDGRVILLKERGWGEHFLVRLNRCHKNVLAQRRWKYACSVLSWFSPDGKYLVQIYEQQTVYLWTVPDGECIGVVEMPEHNISDPLLPSWIDCDGFLKDDRNRKIGIRIDDPQRGPVWVTGARLFRAQSADGQGPKMCIGDSWEIVREGLSGRYDDNITFLCPILRERVVLPDEVISTIDSITRHVINSPVLELPDEAWDDEPRLDFDCPKCGQKHRSTPFYVDRQRSNFNANSDTSR